MTTRLTSKQTHLLQVINELILKNDGLSPTIKELTEKSSSSHARSIRRQLDQLVEAGMIKRDKGAWRGISLTDLGRKELSLPPLQFTKWSKDQNALRLKLHEMDPVLAEWYESGLYALEQTQNSKRFALCSHALREMIRRFQGTDQEDRKAALDSLEASEKPREQDDIRKTRLSRTFDPQGQMGLSEDLNAIYGDLSAIAHAGKEVDEPAFLSRVSALEKLLLNYLFLRQPEAYQMIDEVVEKGVQSATPDHVRMLIGRNADSRQYFFKTIGPEWFDWLLNNGFLKNEVNIARYFVRVAADQPEKVMDWIEENFHITPDLAYFASQYLDAASSMPINTGRRLMKKLVEQHWGKYLRKSLLGHSVVDHLGYLITNESFEEARSFLQEILTVQQDEPKDDSSYQIIRTHFMIEKYNLSLAMQKLDLILAANLYPVIKALLQKIAEFQSLDNAGGYDKSEIWCSRVGEGNDELGYVKSVQIVTNHCIQLLKKLLDHLQRTNRSTIPDVIDRLFESGKGAPLVRRAVFYVGCSYFEDMRSLLSALIIDGIGRDDQYYEYRMLVKEKFNVLSPDVQYQFLKKVKAGPELKRDDDKDWYWKLQHLALIRDSLNEADRLLYERQKARLNITNDDVLEIETGVVTSWSGPNEPQEMRDMGARPVQEVIQYLFNWKQPSDQYHGASVEGLARRLSVDITERPGDWSAALTDSKNSSFQTAYLRSIFSGLESALKKNVGFQWEPVIDFAEWIISKAREATLDDFSSEVDSDFPTNWEGVFKSLASLLTTGLHHETFSPPKKLEKRMWGIVTFLASQSDPSRKTEAEFMSSHGGYHSISINTVRGEGLHALFALIFWRDRHSSPAEKKRARLLPQHKSFLMDILKDNTIRTGTTWFVFGRYFPWLWVFDPKWALSLLSTIFEDTDDELFMAAWEGFLLNNVFLELVPHMKPAYTRAIGALFTGKKKSSTVELTGRLASHLALIFFAGKDSELFDLFMQSSSTKSQRAEVISMIGRSQILHRETKAKPIDSKLAKQFWMDRISLAEPVEMIEFGWWASDEFFDRDFLLDALLETVTATNGAIDNSYDVIRILSKLSAEDPYRCGLILEKMVSVKQDHINNGTALFLHSDKDLIKIVIVALQSSPSPVCNKIADRIIDHLMKRGFSEYRELVLNERIEDSGRAASA